MDFQQKYSLIDRLPGTRSYRARDLDWTRSHVQLLVGGGAAGASAGGNYRAAAGGPVNA
jgi:hypothetical protein